MEISRTKPMVEPSSLRINKILVEEKNKVIYINHQSQIYIISKIGCEENAFIEELLTGKTIDDINTDENLSKEQISALEKIDYLVTSESDYIETVETGDIALKFDLTYSCDMRCTHCFQGNEVKKTDDYIDIEDVKKIFELHIASSCKAVEKIAISGGEPLKHPQFVEILEYLKSKNADITVLTVTCPLSLPTPANAKSKNQPSLVA